MEKQNWNWEMEFDQKFKSSPDLAVINIKTSKSN